MKRASFKGATGANFEWSSELQAILRLAHVLGSHLPSKATVGETEALLRMWADTPAVKFRRK